MCTPSLKRLMTRRQEKFQGIVVFGASFSLPHKTIKCIYNVKIPLPLGFASFDALSGIEAAEDVTGGVDDVDGTAPCVVMNNIIVN